MLVFRNPTLSTFPSANPDLLKLLVLRAHPRSLSPALRPISSPFRLVVASSTALMASPKVVSEYAKSGRSTCKVCGKSISSGSLRLGLSSKNPRGFEMIRWHHLDCVPANARPFASVEEIKGYSLLKSSDQEALRNLEVVVAAKSSVDEFAGRR